MVTTIAKRTDFLMKNKFKASFTFTMSLIAIILCIINPTKQRQLCMYGVLFSTLADLILMDYKGIPNKYFNKKSFYVGMAVFGIAHICYMKCFYSTVAFNTITISEFVMAYILYVIITAISTIIAFHLTYKKSNTFKIAVFLYMLVITLDLAIIYCCADIYGGKYIISAIGITFFLLSDMFILIRETICNTNLIKKLIWIFYPIGQLLIIFSV